MKQGDKFTFENETYEIIEVKYIISGENYYKKVYYKDEAGNVYNSHYDNFENKINRCEILQQQVNGIDVALNILKQYTR